MKFKKVEIQAFRAYNKIQDGTFDFSTESNDVADFISIYAPNGFGKTSFYDAVEWGFTNNIGRFLRRDKDNLSSAKSEGCNYILWNKSAKELGTDCVVRLYTTLSSNPIERKIPKLKANQRDFKFEEKETIKEREYFQQVLLSQEWIDAFLKEDDASVRYEKFIKSFGDVYLDNKYKTIIELIKYNNNKIEGLVQELHDLQSKINFDFDPGILTKINSEIELLNEKGEQISLVQFDYTEKNIQQLTDLISTRITDLRYEISKLQEKITSINSAITGDNISTINIGLYFENKEKIEYSNHELIKLNKIRKQFEEFHEIESLLRNKEQELFKITQEQLKFQELLALYPTYNEVVNELVTKNDLIGKRNEELDEIELKLKPLIDSSNEISVKLNLEIENHQKLSKLLDAFPELSKSFEEKNREKKDLISLIDSSTKIFSEHEVGLNEITKEIIDWQEIVTQISADDFQIPENERTKSFYDTFKRLQHHVKLANEFKTALSETESEITNANKLNISIEQLIAKGADIISKSHSSICPLCKHEHEDFEILFQKVSENTFLSERMKILLARKNKNETDLNDLLTRQKEERKAILITINNNLNNLKENQAKETIAKNELAKTIEGYKLKIKNLDAEINMLLKELGDSDIESLKKGIDEKMTKSTKSLQGLKTSQEENLKIRLPFEQRKNVINAHEIPAFKERITELKSEASYVRIINFIVENQIRDNDIAAELDSRRTGFQKKIRTVKEEMQKCIESIAEYQKALEKNEEEALILGIQQSENEKGLFIQKNSSFEYFLKSELEIDSFNKSKDELGRLLDDMNTLNRKRIFQIEDTIQSFEKMKEYKESVLPFLKHEEFKRKEKTILIDKLFLEKTVNPKLEQERKLLSEYIDRQIESFFHGRLINSIYQKIDPHPVYKEIKFKCDFNNEKPRLNVFVGANGNASIVPTLYFSTAQLNILSLSIFLAKALNVKDNDGNSVDCIFIDDPIQSMDSINILSTIDLLRSISVNMSKQIVLATHDENFHNLLQKKIPIDKFNAKYIELETFGKVKQN